jgi:hypothetical protein
MKCSTFHSSRFSAGVPKTTPFLPGFGVEAPAIGGDNPRFRLKHRDPTLAAARQRTPLNTLPARYKSQKQRSTG